MTPYDAKKTHRWRLAGTVAAVALTAGAGGIAWATDLGSNARSADPTPSASPSSSPSSGQQQKPNPPGKALGHGMFGFGGALHGEFVVPKDGGGYQTVAMQRGEVTDVSNDAVTVKSEDGYSRTYTLTADTLVNAARDGIDNVKKGNTVTVEATVDNGKATAIRLNDGTVRDAIGNKWGFGHRGPR